MAVTLLEKIQIFEQSKFDQLYKMISLFVLKFRKISPWQLLGLYYWNQDILQRNKIINQIYI